MHPLPRVNEIAVEVDDDPRACYFFRLSAEKHIPMALILYLPGNQERHNELLSPFTQEDFNHKFPQEVYS